MSTIRVFNPKAVFVPAIADLFRRGFADSPVVPGGFDEAIHEFVNIIQDPKSGVFLASEDATPVGFLIVSLPRNALVPYPQVLHLYSEGKPKVAEGLIDMGLAFITSHGYTRFWALNASRKPDEVWMRALRHAGVATPLATLMEFEV